MPTQERIWLHNIESLFPEFREVGKKNETNSIRVAQLRSLDALESTVAGVTTHFLELDRYDCVLDLKVNQ